MVTKEENALWASLFAELEPLHARDASREICNHSVALPRDRIPSLAEVTALVAPRTGFVLRPVAGLVPSRQFLAPLARSVFSSTTKIRDARTPHYTPEPDVVHEFIGHAASLANPKIAELNRALGRAAITADDAMLERLDRFYWFTLEFGLIEERGGPKALGAGLLSSVAEMKRFSSVELRDFSWDEIVETNFSTTAMQDVLFVAPSVDAIASSLRRAFTRRAFVFPETRVIEERTRHR
jgi:phenylalanine-4-hydroxylase